MTAENLARINTPGGQITIAIAATLFVVATAFAGPYAVIVASLPLALWLAISYPTFWVVVFLALSQYRLPDALPFLRPFQLPLYFGAMTLASMLWHVAIARTFQAIWRRELVIMLVLLALALIGLIVAIDKPHTQQYIFENYWKIIAVAFAIAWTIQRQEDFRRVALVSLASGTVIALVAIYNKHFGIDLVEGTRVTIGKAFNSPLADPNDLSLALLTPFCFGLAMLACRADRRMCILSAITVGTTLLGIIATQSRGGLLGVLAAIAVIGLSLVRSRNTLYALIAGAGVLLFIVMGISSRQSGGFAEYADGGIDKSSYLRTLAWTAAVNMAAARPFTGVGLGGFPSSFIFYTPDWVGRDLAPHSTWFGMLGEMGIPGLIALLMMIVAAFQRAIFARKALDTPETRNDIRGLALGLQASLVSFCVSGSFLGQHATWPLYSLTALVVAFGIYAERQVKERDLSAKPK